MTATPTYPELALRSLTTDWNFARWEALPDDGNRYEIIDGVLYMTTAPSTFHQWIISRLLRLVGHVLEDRGWGYAFIAPIGVLMPGCDPVQPDFLLVRRDHAAIIADRRIRGVPDLIVEVVSPGSVEQDTMIKREAYARAGVPEFWLVRPALRDILVHSEPDVVQGTYTRTGQVSEQDELPAATIPIQLPVRALFAGAPDTTV
ncbi:MAG: Uma2 family endonuclease [Kouleothrix sp.]